MKDDFPSRDATRSGSPDDDDDPRIVAAVKEYFTLLENGRPSRAEFLARYPEIAAPLAECLDGLEMVHGAAATPQLAKSVNWLTRQPESLGDFRILREIGRGGMGVVYEALHVPLARRVALKILPSIDSFDSLRLQRFKTEAQAAARLQHPGIVQVFSVGCDNNIHYYAMQLVDGSPLSAVIDRLRQMAGKNPRGDTPLSYESLTGRPARAPAAPTRAVGHQSTNRPLADAGRTADDTAQAREERLDTLPIVRAYSQPAEYFRQSVRLIQQAAVALEHAHESGVVHRDVKPANLLVNDQGRMWVADFGLARIEASTHLTRTGTPLGTLRYMSPEQAAGNAGLIDHRADVYSLGITLYELLTLEPAIPGDDSPTLLRRVVDEEPLPPSTHNASIPSDLETVVLKAIAKERDERYGSAQQFADDLERWLDDKPILARPPSRWERATKWGRRHRTFVKTAAAAATLAVFALLIVTLIVSRAYRDEARQHQAAAASFEQARRAVDAFAEFGETELAAKPELRDVRRRLLETALNYYREFVRDHADDPQALAEIQAATERIGHIVDELIVLEDAAPLFLLADRRVQDDLQLGDTQRGQAMELLKSLSIDRNATERNKGADDDKNSQPASALLREHAAELRAILQAEQATRLQQIARQQRTPFVFRTSEVIDALQLTPQQRQQINVIIEEERIGGRGRGPASFDGDGPRSGRRGGPRNDFRGRDDGRGGPDDWQFDDGRGRRDDRRGGPDFQDRGRGPGPPGMAEARNRTVTRILEILTPQQRAEWDRLIGRPFEYDLHWGPDNILPR